MRPSRIKEKFRQGKPAYITCVHYTDPTITEMISQMGVDGIWLDMEHHGYSLATAANMMRGARVGVSDIVARPAKGEFMRMARMLEAGANAIMYPRCDNAEEAAEVVRWAKFAPMGERGIDAANADNPYLLTPVPEYLPKANDETLVVIQIEQEHALDEVEKIAAVDGVDCIMLGPGDFSVLSEIPGQMDHPKILDAKKRIAAAAKANGKQWGCPAGTLDDVSALLDLGARFICYGVDIVFVLQAYQKIIADLSKLGFTFDGAAFSPKQD